MPSNGRAPRKQLLRQHFKPQLAALWRYEPLLSQRKYLNPPGPDNEISNLIEFGGHTFAPMVTRQLNLLAELDILMLRPERPGRIVRRADIDNRLKTLFDGLKAPSEPDEKNALPAVPSTAADPLFTLLEDDSLITRINVDTDRMLAEPADPKDVLLIIRVTVRASSLDRA